MALMRHMATGHEVAVRAGSIVGRSARADIHLTGEGVSANHASIQWNGAEWILRDFASRNGTKINDTSLFGQEWRLVPGDVITFGDPDERWRWIEGNAPQPLARCGSRVISATNHHLLLPDDAEPLASIYVGDGSWEVEIGGTRRSIEDGETIEVGGRAYSVDLPMIVPSVGRTRSVESARRVRQGRIAFRVSKDEEHVEVMLGLGAISKTLPARACHYMLLILGRARQADRAAGLAEDEAGWIYATDLAKALVTSMEKLNVDVLRARAAVAQTDLFSNPQDIVERRRGQLRLGISDIVLGRPTTP